MTEADLVPHSMWKHKKTGDFYTIVGIARVATNGREGEWEVVYLSDHQHILFVREIGEFLAPGRFERVLCPAKR